MNSDDALDLIRLLIETAADRGKPTAERLQAAEKLAREWAAFDDALQIGADLPSDWDDDDTPADAFDAFDRDVIGR